MQHAHGLNALSGPLRRAIPRQRSNAALNAAAGALHGPHQLRSPDSVRLGAVAQLSSSSRGDSRGRQWHATAGSRGDSAQAGTDGTLRAPHAPAHAHQTVGRQGQDGVNSETARAHIGRIKQGQKAGARSCQPVLLAARQHVRPQARVLSQLSHAQAGARRPRARHRCSGGRQGRTQDRSRVRLSRRSRGGRAASSLKTHRLRHPPRELTLHHITHVAFAVSKRATQQPQLLLFLDVSVLVKGQRLYGDATRDEIGGVGVAPAVPARISGQEAPAHQPRPGPAHSGS